MGTRDITHMLLVVALEIMKISIIVTATRVTQSLAATVMIVMIMIDGTVVEDGAAKSNAHCRTMSKNRNHK
jgi:hypothetical protein